MPRNDQDNAGISIKEVSKSKSAAELTELVRRFAEDQGPIGQEALQALQARPRTELIESLLSLERSLPVDDHLRPQIAFLLCWVDHDCAHNIRFRN